MAMIKTTWKRCTRDAYWWSFECLPPAAMRYSGFLVGEPYSFRTCAVTGKQTETFTAFMTTKVGAKEAFFKAETPLTLAEFNAAMDVLAAAQTFLTQRGPGGDAGRPKRHAGASELED